MSVLPWTGNDRGAVVPGFLPSFFLFLSRSAASGDRCAAPIDRVFPGWLPSFTADLTEYQRLNEAFTEFRPLQLSFPLMTFDLIAIRHDVTGFYRVLPSFTELYRVVLGFIEFYWVFARYYWVLPGFTGFY